MYGAIDAVVVESLSADGDALAVHHSSTQTCTQAREFGGRSRLLMRPLTWSFAAYVASLGCSQGVGCVWLSDVV